MDRDRLERYLEEGLSLPQIGSLENRDPSTVGYWVSKHGLVANGREKFAPRGTIGRAELLALVEANLTTREIAAKLGRSQSTVNHWLRRYALKTKRAQRGRRAAAQQAFARGESMFDWECGRHGLTTFHVFQSGRSRCAKCSSEAVHRRRKKNKKELAAEAGGCCALCGYDRCLAALQFHHLDPDQKAFGLSSGGVTKGMKTLRAEAAKCVLLCATCHAEVEAGFSSVS